MKKIAIQSDKSDIEREAHAIVEETEGLAYEEQLEFVRNACGTKPQLLEHCMSLLSYQLSDDSFVDLLYSNDQADAGQYDLTGQVVGSYRIDRKIGSGGTAEVFLAYRNDNIHHHPVALKIIRGWGNAHELMERMKYERKVLSQFKHPNIASFLDGGNAKDGRPYFVLEYVEGKPITDYCKDKNTSLDARLRLFIDVCSAVYAAHAKLTLHRDIKPKNILVTDDGFPKLLDFGIAKILDEGSLGEAQLTQFLSPMTPQYASPEQVRQEPLSVASDQYSLGVLLYELVTHFLPNDFGKDPVLEHANYRDVKLPSVRIAERKDIDHLEKKYLIKRLREGLDAVIMKAIDCDVEKRYSSVSEFSKDIFRYLQGRSILAKKENCLSRSIRLIKKNRKNVAFVTVSAVMFFSLATVQQLNTIAERDNALNEKKKFEQTQDFLLSLFKLSHPEKNLKEHITVREALDHGIDVIDEKFKHEPEVKASLLLSMARAYQHLHLTNRAFDLLQESLNLQQMHISTEDEIRAMTLTSMAELLIKKGGNKRAKAMIGQAIDIYPTLDTVNVNNVVDTYFVAGMLFNRSGEYDKAINHHRKAIAILLKNVPSDTSSLIKLYMGLGAVYTDKGEYVQAQIYNKKALALKLHYPDKELLVTSLIYNTIAVVHHLQGQYSEALGHYLKAIAIRKQVSGEQNSRMVIPYNNIGELLTAMGEYDQAIGYHNKALKILSENNNTELYYLAITHNRLGDALAGKEQFSLALEHIEKSLVIRKEIYGEHHHDLAKSYNSYGDVYIAMGESSLAQDYYRKSLAIRHSTYGNDHSLTKDTQAKLSKLAGMLAQERATLAGPYGDDAVGKVADMVMRSEITAP